MYNFQRLDANKYTEGDILNEISEYCQNLALLGYEDVLLNHYCVTFNNRMVRTWGRCKRISLNYYEIIINSNVLKYGTVEHIHQLIAHETVHSISGCMNHGKKWQRAAHALAAKCNLKDIFRCESMTEISELYKKPEIMGKQAYKWSMTCMSCGNTTYAHRLKKTYAAVQSGYTKHYKWVQCGKYGQRNNFHVIELR